jgi:hypothetical protein
MTSIPINNTADNLDENTKAICTRVLKLLNMVELQSTGGEKLYEHGQNIFLKAGYALLSSRRSCSSMVQVNAGYHHVKGMCKSFTIKHQGQ